LDEPLLIVRNLRKYFSIRSRIFKRQIGWLRAVDGVSLDVCRGETVGLVGESGCGKTTLGKTILGIYRPLEGDILFRNQDITRLSPDGIRRMRAHIQYVYQDSVASLDSWWSVGRLLREPLVIHTNLNRAEIDNKVLSILEAVGMHRHHMSSYPHEFSGGQLRRLGLARILTLNPELVIFDEPTAGLDVSVQAKILELLQNLKETFDLTYIMISHNLGLIRMICVRTAVMYLGNIVEMGSTEKVFEEPKHPYTQILISSSPDPRRGKKTHKLLLKGEPPSMEKLPSGCRFHPRCPFVREGCETDEPSLCEVSPDHFVSCHFNWLEGS
jgi:oligopeptide/dipeptide ABC transporter ATP-binding protein